MYVCIFMYGAEIAVTISAVTRLSPTSFAIINVFEKWWWLLLFRYVAKNGVQASMECEKCPSHHTSNFDR